MPFWCRVQKVIAKTVKGDFPLCFLLGVLWFQGGVGDYAPSYAGLPILVSLLAMNIEPLGRKRLAESNRGQLH